MELSSILILAGAALAAGMMNAIAGGGTLLTFPALMAVVTPAASANATSTLALLPGSLAGTWGFRRELYRARAFAGIMILPSFLGGLTGSILLVVYQNQFRDLVPWLILAAAVLFLAQQPLARLVKKRFQSFTSDDYHRLAKDPEKKALPKHMPLLMFGQFLIAVYGGYFGAGIGILMLATLGFMGLEDLHEINAVKNLLASVINIVAVIIFIASGLVNWPYALLMAGSAIIGGYTGARLTRLLPQYLARYLVIILGFSLACYYFLAR